MFWLLVLRQDDVLDPSCFNSLVWNVVVFQTVEIWAVLDGEPEGNETFTVTLSNPTGGARLGEELQAFVTVLENLAPAGLFRITPSVNRCERGRGRGGPAARAGE